MKILVTGSAGFIGYHLCLKLLKKKTFKVYGIDNFNSYYDIKLKKIRNNLLLKKKNFYFNKINFSKKKKLEKIFIKIQPDIIYHIGGQPGVIYSYKNPNSYKKNNIIATKLLCDLALKYKISKFIFASSSSIYGDQKKYPINENFIKKPKNYYAKTKLSCEKILLSKFKFSEINFFIFRFFTVYGPLGRPDMFIHKFLNNLKFNKITKIYNFGKNFRDYTFVDDVVHFLHLAIKIKTNINIFNICGSKPIKTLKLIQLIKNIYKCKKTKIQYVNKQRGEMIKTYGSNKRLITVFGKYIFRNINYGLYKTIKCFKKFNY